MPDPDPTLRALSERVRILESENARLVEQAEDAVVLGLVAQAVVRGESRDDVLVAGLEKIALLKQLPWAAYVRLVPRAFRVVVSFATERPEASAPTTLEVPAPWRAALAAGEPRVLTGSRLPGCWPLEKLAGPGRTASLAVCWVPDRSERAGGRGFLFLVPEDADERLVSLLRRASETMGLAAHRLELRASLAAYNRDLGADRLPHVGGGEAALLEAAEIAHRLLVLVETVPDLVGSADADGHITYVNRAGRRLLGIDDGVDVRRYRIDDMHPPGKLGLLRDVAVAAAARDGVWEGEMPFRRFDGTTIPMWQILCVQRGPGGEVQGFFTVAHDLRDQRELEAQLRQAQKMEALGTLVGGVAHDFNNLLAAITGNLFLARTNLREPRVAEERLREIEALCCGATSLISRLLAFARKGPPSALAPLDLREVVSGSMALLRAALPESIRLSVDPGPSPARMHGDPHQLQQVLLNLATNARHALSETRRPAVEVRVEVVAPTPSLRARHDYTEDRPLVQLTVRDNGCGIPDAVRSRIFDPFFTTRAPGGGTGLGLSMVYAALQAHGGYVEIESAVGEGTAFHLLFPADRGAPAAAVASPSATLAGAGETVLVVDDEDAVRRTIARCVRAIGYRSLEAVDGPEALALLEKRGPEIALAVMDVVMPNLSGPSVVRRLRRSGSSVPVLLVTGYRDRTIPQSQPLPTGTALLQKPFSVPELSQAMRSLLGAGEPKPPACPRPPSARR